jgi:hypothetical protein
MSKLVRSQLPYLVLLQSTTPQQRRALIQTMSRQQLTAICEVILNVFKGVFRLAKDVIKRLRRYESFIRALASREESRTSKRKILIKIQRLLPDLLRPALRFLGNGTRSRSGTTRKISTDAKGTTEQ